MRMSLGTRRQRQRGVTLIELMVTVAVAAVLLAVAAPSFRTVVNNSRLTGHANTLLASAQLARSEAIKRNSPVRLCRSSNGTTCAAAGGWEQGWIVLHPTSPVGQQVISVQQALGNGFTMTGPNVPIDFQAIGAGSTTGAFKICAANSSEGQGRDITLSATGRVSISPDKTGVCP